MALHEFLSYGPQKDAENVKPMLRKTKDDRIFEWKVEKDDPLCTLKDAFLKVKRSLGFNIELKFDDNIVYTEQELRQTLDTILKVNNRLILHQSNLVMSPHIYQFFYEQVVDEHAKNRPIIFSSFHPDAAQLMRKMQRSYPVRLLFWFSFLHLDVHFAQQPAIKSCSICSYLLTTSTG